MLKGSASQGGKEQRKKVLRHLGLGKHRKASQGRKDRSTLRERQQETQGEETVSQKKLSGSLTDEQEFVLA